MPHLKDKETGLCLICHRNQLAAIKQGQMFKRNNYNLKKFDNMLKTDVRNYRDDSGRHYVKLNQSETNAYQPSLTKFAKKMELDKLNKKLAAKSLDLTELNGKITGRMSKKTNNSNQESIIFDFEDRSNHNNRLASKSNYSIYTVKSPFEEDPPTRLPLSRNEFYSKANYTAKKDIPIGHNSKASNSLSELIIIESDSDNNDDILKLIKTAESIHNSMPKNKDDLRRSKKIVYHHHFEVESSNMNEDEDYVYYGNYV